MTLAVEVVDELCREVFPARSDAVSLEYISAEVGAPSWGYRRDQTPLVMLTVRLFTWDGVGDARAIRDIKEQTVAFAPADISLERFRAYLEAFVEVLSRAFAVDGVEVDTLMPHDLVHAEVLTLKTAQVKADFVKAFEQKSRFGRWLSRGSASSPTAVRPEDEPKKPPPDPDTSL